MVTVRYIVMDVPESVEFYTKHLEFTIALDARPGFAIIARGLLRLALSGVAEIKRHAACDGLCAFS
jgi:hypothetical protein